MSDTDNDPDTVSTASRMCSQSKCSNTPEGNFKTCSRCCQKNAEAQRAKRKRDTEKAVTNKRVHLELSEANTNEGSDDDLEKNATGSAMAFIKFPDSTAFWLPWRSGKSQVIDSGYMRTKSEQQGTVRDIGVVKILTISKKSVPALGKVQRKGIPLRLQGITAYIKYQWQHRWTAQALPEEAAAIIRAKIEHTTPVAMVGHIQSLFPQVTAKPIHTSLLTSARLLLEDYPNDHDVDILDVHVADGVEILPFVTFFHKNPWYISETQWKRDSSQLTSARLLLEDYPNDVDILDIHVPDGVEILPFVTFFLKNRGRGPSHHRSIANGCQGMTSVVRARGGNRHEKRPKFRFYYRPVETVFGTIKRRGIHIAA
ncbi:hypothetical protein GGX14DRAFT_397079 [Mycena pura]|uniref:Uncharacterized protein n=1 Tax=Mycena pura TaxID=153505 RepID=A0AAD6V9T2_9AGAR|nr:hypothetical protein GGX14DRAFT_397079 [Mycena pura]